MGAALRFLAEKIGQEHRGRFEISDHRSEGSQANNAKRTLFPGGGGPIGLKTGVVLHFETAHLKEETMGVFRVDHEEGIGPISGDSNTPLFEDGFCRFEVINLDLKGMPRITKARMVLAQE